jgi:uncharacterized protein YciI
MWYCIYCEDIPNSLPLRKQARPAHLERLEALQTEGRLLTAGPCPAIDSEDPGENGFTGSLIVADFESLEDAEQWAESDPYKQQGVYANIKIKPFLKVF